ncbi:MAG: ArsC/Spx/MgsR family protein [Paracoccaceae bacterium]
MRLYGLKNCDSCRKARAALVAAGHDVDFVDVRETPIAPEVMARFLDSFGDTLVNHRSTTWRGLSEEARAADPATLLSAHPALMKRPLIEADGALYLGWDAATRTALLP